MYLITQNVILDQFADDFPISLKNIFYVQKAKIKDVHFFESTFWNFDKVDVPLLNSNLNEKELGGK